LLPPFFFFSPSSSPRVFAATSASSLAAAQRAEVVTKEIRVAVCRNGREVDDDRGESQEWMVSINSGSSYRTPDL